jgi:dTDP-4-amino-4,6-dideoxygalactose transaminase
MYRVGQKQCVSFGHGKPLQLGKCGAILLDSKAEYLALSCMRSDGRDLGITPWQAQEVFHVGYHYKPTTEEAELGSHLLPLINERPKYVEYPDCRKIKIID